MKRQGAAYQGALEAVFAIPIALGIGYLVDQRLGTYPVFLFVGVGVGFAAFVVRLWRLGRDLQGPGNGESPAQPEPREDE